MLLGFTWMSYLTRFENLHSVVWLPALNFSRRGGRSPASARVIPGPRAPPSAALPPAALREAEAEAEGESLKKREARGHFVKKRTLHPPRIELGTFCLQDRCSTTEP